MELKPGGEGMDEERQKSLWVKEAALASKCLSVALSEPQHTADLRSSDKAVHLSADVPESSLRSAQPCWDHPSHPRKKPPCVLMLLIQSRLTLPALP